MARAEDIGFYIAIVRPDDFEGMTRVAVTPYGTDAVFEKLLARSYPGSCRSIPETLNFDQGEADRQIAGHGFTRTGEWEWAATDWIALIERPEG